MIRTYSELSKIDTFLGRYNYLKLDGSVGTQTFGPDRMLNQIFYQQIPEWKAIRREVIVRDLGCDLGLAGYEIGGRIIVHHMNPITKADILTRSDLLLDPEYLICVSPITHEAIHYGDEKLFPTPAAERVPNDTCPWKNNFTK